MQTRTKTGSDFGDITEAVTLSTLRSYDLAKLIFLLDQLNDQNLEKLESAARVTILERQKDI